MSQHVLATRMVRLYGTVGLSCITASAFKLALGLARGETDTTVRYLLDHKLISHHKRGCYQLTEAGEAAAASPDGVLKSKTGVATSATQQQTQGASGIRGSAWRALRISPKQTMDEILSRVDDGTTATAKPRVARYLSGLIAASVVRKHGKHYILLNDLGPLGPTVGQRGQVFDPNAGVFLQRVKP
jgi:hypothetical protein